MPEEVYLIGAGRTDFKRNLRKEGKTLRDVIVEAGRAAIADAGIEPGDVQSGVVGNFAAGLFTRQLHLGSYLTEIDPKLRGIPTMHVEAACASGSTALLAGAQQIMAGLRDCVIVVGAEQQKTMSPADGAEVLGAAGDYHVEKETYGQFLFPKLFGRIAQLYMQRYDLSERQLALVAVKNYAHAKLNPMAQMRDATMTAQQACAASEANPAIAPPLKVSDCSQVTDGAAAVVLCSRLMAQKFASRRLSVRLLGFGHTTDYLPLDKKDVPDFSTARKAGVQAYAMAKLTPGELHGIEVHDCFSISEIVAYELLGLADHGQGARLVQSGATALPSVREQIGVGTKPPLSVPVNAGGGLIGDGHPVGATGVRQVVEIYQQLTERAGARQIAGAKQMLAFNMGGSFTTAVATIWGR